MAITPLTVTIDLNPSYKKIPAVYVSQLDNNLRELAITVQDGGVNYDVASSGYDVYVEGTKPDKHGFSYKVTDIGGTVVGSVVTVPMQTQMTCVKGMVSTEIVLKSGSDRIGSANFLLVVERAGLDEDTDVSETDIPGYIDGAQRAAEAAEQAKDDAVDAKNTAVAVAASIPEDYTTLSNDVDDLKSAFDYYEPVNFLNKNDTEQFDTTFVYSNYIPAKLNDSFAFYWSSDPSNLTHGTPRNWMYYDENKNKLGETATWTQDYTVTSDSVAYIRAVLNKAHVNAYAMIEKNQNPAIKIYSDYFAPHYVANDSIARSEISDTEALIFDETSTIKGTYTKGTISQGNYIYVSYRIAETELLSFPCTKTIYIKDGFRAGFHCFKDGVFAFDSGWKTGFYYIPKGYQFKFVITRVNESSSEVIADINEFINAVYYKTDLINDRNTVNQCLMSIAHQGFSTTRSYYGDSRISSYIGAAQHGFECAETDVQFASDGVPVCCHDPSFTDATSGNTINIADHTAAELKTYDYFGESISTLEEVISTCKMYGLKLELDKVNSGWTEANWSAVFELVTKYQMQKNVIWTCPNPTCADKILAYDSHAVLMMNTSAQYLSGTIITAKTIATETNTVIVACNYNGLAVNDLITCNQQIGNDNIHIAVWTIDDIATYKQFMPYAWAITSNKLKAADVI